MELFGQKQVRCWKVARDAGGGTVSTAALAFGGNPGGTDRTEEWSRSSTTIKVLTD